MGEDNNMATVVVVYPKVSDLFFPQVKEATHPDLHRHSKDPTRA